MRAVSVIVMASEPGAMSSGLAVCSSALVEAVVGVVVRARSTTVTSISSSPAWEGAAGSVATMCAS